MRQLSTDLQRPQQSQRRYSRPNLPPLFYAVIGRNWDAAVRRSISHPHEIVCVEDSSGDTPLHIACRLDPPKELIEALLSARMEKNKEGATALHVAACHRCSADVIELMVSHHQSDKEFEPLVLQLTNRGRTPLHYACLSFRGLSIDAFKVLVEATMSSFGEKQNSIVGQEEDSFSDSEMNFELERNDVKEEQVNVFTMQDHLGHSPLSLLFKRYRERVKYVIRYLDSHKNISSSVAANAVREELGGLWLKARLIVCLMAEKKRKEEQILSPDGNGDICFAKENAVEFAAARWAAQRHRSSIDSDYDDDIEASDMGERKFRLVHASVALVGYGCPTEMIRLAMSVYPNQVREMDEEGNLPLHIAAVATSYLPESCSNMNGCPSDEDSYISYLSSISGMSSKFPPSFLSVIRMLLESYPDAAKIPHGLSGRLPFVLAIEARKRSLNDGLRLLLEAFPSAVESKELDPKLYPMILSILAKPKDVKVISNHSKFGKQKDVKKYIPVALFNALQSKPSILITRSS